MLGCQAYFWRSVAQKMPDTENAYKESFCFRVAETSIYIVANATEGGTATKERNKMKKIFVTLVFICALTAVAFGQTTAEEWFARGGELYNNGDYTNAVTAYSEAIRRGSTNLDAYWFRSVSYFQIRNYDACIADCTTVIRGAPDFPTVYTVRGDAYGAKGLYHNAIADYRTAWEKGYDSSNFNVDKSNNADMWYCGAMHMEIVINRFLGNSAVVTRYENRLNAVCNRNRVTRAEVETFYRNNVRGLVSQVVDEEFRTLEIIYSEDNVAFPQSLLNEVKEVLTVFLITPNQNTFVSVRNIYLASDKLGEIIILNNVMQIARSSEGTNSSRYRQIVNDLQTLNNELVNISGSLRTFNLTTSSNALTWYSVNYAYLNVIKKFNSVLPQRITQ